MLLSTQGLVLHTTKYAETSIIAKVFTRELGLCSYIVKGVRSASGRTKQNLLQPMSHLEMTVYNNPKKQMQYIKEMHPAAHYSETHADPVGLALLFFMDEVLYKSLKESEPNTPLFDYVADELLALNSHFATTTEEPATQRINTYPINFLLGTARHLGIEPMDNYSHRMPSFNLKEGRFFPSPTTFTAASNPNSDYFLDIASSSCFHGCLSSHASQTPMPHLDARQRNTTLSNLLEYYHIHLSDFNNFTSHQILHSVLR